MLTTRSQRIATVALRTVLAHGRQAGCTALRTASAASPWPSQRAMSTEASPTGADAGHERSGGTTRGIHGLPSREDQVTRLASDEVFDVLVIGGGSTGAGCALDAATRGLSTACVERSDFSAGTSSRSTKLIWAGSRYLVQAMVKLFSFQLIKSPIGTVKSFLADFHMVMGAQRERSHLLETMPHLTKWLPIAVPLNKWLLWPPPFNYPPAALGPLGMFPIFFKFYDLLAKFRCPGSYVMGKKTTYEKFPQLTRNIKYTQVFYEGQHNDSRTNLSVALTAAKQGAAIANYVEIEALLHDKDGKATGATARDLETGKTFDIKAKSVIFAGGPFTDGLRKLEDPNAKPVVSGAGGTHIVLPNYYCPRDMGLVDMSTSDGRFLFFLPWLDHTIVGTTDSPTSPSMRPEPPEDEIQWILNEASKYLSDDLQVRRSDVLSAWHGIRPLAVDPHATSTASASRDHTISVNPKNGVLFVAGGKWTTYREMAEDAIDRTIEEKNLKPVSGCVTLSTKVLGYDGYHKNLPVQLVQQFDIDYSAATHLANTYGGRAWDVCALAEPTGERWPKFGKLLVDGYPYLEAEVKYACHEYARTVEDVLTRRTRLAFLNREATKQAVTRTVEIMAKELGWDEERIEEERAATKVWLRQFGGPRPHKEGATLRAATLADLRIVFDALDADGSGSLEREELLQASADLGFAMSDEEVTAAMVRMDTNKDGSASFDEFVAWWNSDDNDAMKNELNAKMGATPAKLEHATGVAFG